MCGAFRSCHLSEERRRESSLDQRFPQKDASDEMSEVLQAIFSMQAAEGENLKTWISRATELFDRCQRKVNVNFPEEARGWLILHRSGLLSEQKAVILARSLGSLKREDIGRSMRSVYPGYVVSKRRAAGVSLIEDATSVADDNIDPEDEELLEFEQFIAEHQVTGDEPEEAFDEPDVAEALAVSWRERRKEMGQLQRARKFKQAQDVRRSFKVEIEELKRRVKCNKCGAVGHWARECKAAGKGSGKSKSLPVKGKENAAAMVVEETFVALVDCQTTPWLSLHLLRERQARTFSTESEQLLVSSPGFGVLDSGCGRSIIGADTLAEFMELWKTHRTTPPMPFDEVNHFKYGSGQQETSKQAIKVPVILGGCKGTIKAAIVQGQAPLLISRSALKTLKAVINFETNELTVFDSRTVVPLSMNQAGQYTVDLMGSPAETSDSFSEIMLSAPAELSEQPSSTPAAISPSEACEPTPVEDQVPGPEHPKLSQWSRVDAFSSHIPAIGKQGPRWSSVRRRIVTDMDTHEVLFDEQIQPQRGKSFYRRALPSSVWRCQTEYHFLPQEETSTIETLPVHHLRQLEARTKEVSSTTESFVPSKVDGKHFMVAEVFSPPRFCSLVHQMGFSGRSCDLVNGFDFRRVADRNRVTSELAQAPPKLLVLCPPCADEGGWFRLNSIYMEASERARRIAQSRMYIRFCCKLFKQQVSLGGKAIFEHPQGSNLWSYPEVQALVKDHELLLCHMCRYGLRLPGQSKLLKKATHLLVSHEDMKCLARQCPGPTHPKHSCHQEIAGSAPGVGQVSTFAGQYTPQFVHATLNTIPAFRQSTAASLVQCAPCTESQCQEVLMSRNDLQADKSEADICKVLDSLHRNLGHPPAHDLVRILKHANASEKAITLARQFECDICKNQIRPHVALPAKTGRVPGFNEVVGLDVKNLPGWHANQKVKALNIVCHGSCYQMMIPFFQTEATALIRQLFTEHWIRPFGPPKALVIDQARTNMGEALQNHLDLQGTEVRQIAGEAHWQLGRTEVQGGWFSRILTKILAEHLPETKEDWEECVVHAHVKNHLIQNYGYTPHQHVSGQNPRVPTDLLDEPLHVVPATASLSEETLAKTQAIHLSARRAVIEMQDSTSLRRALASRPRLHQQFEPGALVAYWRHQKFQAGQGVLLGGRWYGTAVVIGLVGRNYIIAHRKHIFRCAPEQLRPATGEERALVQTPQTELLGIRDMIEGGTFRSQNFVDLVPGHYPPEQSSEQQDMSSEAVPDVPAPVESTPELPHASEHQTMDTDNAPETPESEQSEPKRTSSSLDRESGASYGPVRTRSRIHMKSGPAALHVPAHTDAQDDFIDLMKEVVPRLIAEHVSTAPVSENHPNWNPDQDTHEASG